MFYTHINNELYYFCIIPGSEIVMHCDGYRDGPRSDQEHQQTDHGSFEMPKTQNDKKANKYFWSLIKLRPNS